MTNTNQDNLTDYTNKFCMEEQINLTEGLTIRYQLRNKSSEPMYGKTSTGDWNSLIIITYPRCDSPCANLLDIWNITSKDIKSMVNSLNKINTELERQEEIRGKIDTLRTGS